MCGCHGYPAKIFINKIRLTRTDPYILGGNNFNLEVAEVQIWVDNINIAPRLKFRSSHSISEINFKLNNVNDEDLDTLYIATDSDVQVRYINNETDLNNEPIYLEAEFTKFNLEKLQSIVIYGRNHENSDTKSRLKGASLQILSNDAIVYSKEITEIGINNTNSQLVFRFDGPDISTVNSFDTQSSTMKIISNSNLEVIRYLINDYNISKNVFNVIRVLRTRDSATAGNTTDIGYSQFIIQEKEDILYSSQDRNRIILKSNRGNYFNINMTYGKNILSNTQDYEDASFQLRKPSDFGGANTTNRYVLWNPYDNIGVSAWNSGNYFARKNYTFLGESRFSSQTELI